MKTKNRAKKTAIAPATFRRLIRPWTSLVLLCSQAFAPAATMEEIKPVNAFTHGQGLFYGSALSETIPGSGQGELLSMAEEGYRPVHVNAFMPMGGMANADAQYAYAWVHDDDCAFPFGIAPQVTPLQLASGLPGFDGYRPVSITGHRLSALESRLTVVFLRDGSDADWMYLLDKTGAAYQTAVDQAAEQGYRPLSVSGYSHQGVDTRFSAIFVRDNLPTQDWATHHGIKEEEYQAYMDTWVEAGFWPISLSAYTVGDETHFTTVMIRHQGVGASWVARHGMTSAELTDANDLWTSDDNPHGTVLRPVVVAAYQSGGQFGPKRYAAVWRSSSKRHMVKTGVEQPQLIALDDAMEALMKGKDVNAATLTVARHGQVKLSRGYTWAPAEFPITFPHTRFRIASASKALTAVAVMKLLEEPILTGMKGGGLAALTLDTPIFQIYGMPDLPAEYGAAAAQMTIREVLRHRAGWDRAIWEPLYSDTTIAQALGKNLPVSRKDMIDYMMTPSLWPSAGDPESIGYVNDPGPVWAYSNFGYSVLAELIEVIKEEPYEDYVRRNVLLPVGANQTHLGRTARLLKKVDPDEAIYTAGQSASPRWYVSDSNFDPATLLNPTTQSRVGLEEPGASFPTTAYGRYNIHTIDAAGGWVATAPDMVKLLSSFDAYDGNLGGSDTPVLDWNSMWEMWVNPANVSQDVSIGGDYVLGWQRASVCSAAGTNVTIWYHGGAVDGAMSLIAHRSDGISFAAMFSRLEWGNGFTELNNAICSISQWPLDWLAPVIGAIPDHSVEPGTPIPPIVFEVQDDETPANRIRLAARSSNEALLPSHDIAIQEADGIRSLKLYPIAGMIGETTVILTATDGDGLSSEESFLLRIENPNLPPTLDWIADVRSTGCATTAEARLTGIGDGEGTKRIGTVVILATSNSPHLPHPSVDYTAGETTAVLRWAVPRSPSGSAVIEVEVDDGEANDNVVRRSFTYSWAHDVTPPEVQCPASIAIQAASSEGAWVEYDVQAQDDSAGPVQILCTPASGSLFPLGTTLVTCQAQDACGNVSSCQFEVTVWRPGIWLTRGRFGGGVEISWEKPGALLEMAENANGPWRALTAATSPYRVDAKESCAFFRLAEEEVGEDKRFE